MISELGPDYRELLISVDDLAVMTEAKDYFFESFLPRHKVCDFCFGVRSQFLPVKNCDWGFKVLVA
jgi:hypothetical protein